VNLELQNLLKVFPEVKYETLEISGVFGKVYQFALMKEYIHRFDRPQISSLGNNVFITER